MNTISHTGINDDITGKWARFKGNYIQIELMKILSITARELGSYF